ncbi:hypothetical protein Zmor_000631 [Zophobas morio]|uniref:Reverse transcriptase domain-containing protein n=1 Tax=Zophobas morio TaxID=2755281 RepID=A0AA38J0E0_9CUCU|nr:hypothetical protein Zmor_000631 [Zophobas morio]
MACLDIEKAFDKVWIRGLLYKLIKLEFPKNLPVWRGVSKTTLSTPQVFQNKCLRLALNKDRHTKITELQTLSGIPSIRNYIEKLSGNFYKSQTKHNPLLKKAIRHPQGKHKFTYTGASLS